MKKTAEAVSLGHPDKTADYISSYLLDYLIERDCHTKYAVEVMIKDNTVILGGEVTSNARFEDVHALVKHALADIGYDSNYAKIWQECAIEPDKLKVINLIGTQSPDIQHGVVQNGWGDQGVFVGYACQGPDFISKELYLAKKLNRALYDYALTHENLGIDIKTQITLDDDGKVETAIAAVPMKEKVDLTDVICKVLQTDHCRIIVNGTGIYTQHSSIADCGVTGRKLACDFYSTSSAIGGGSPWTKDASKADLTLNLYARKLAIENLKDNDECFVYLSSCIGRADLPSAQMRQIKNSMACETGLIIPQTPQELIEQMHLNTPIYARLCKQGITSFVFE